MKVLVLLSIFVAVSVASAEPFVVIVRDAEKAANDSKDPEWPRVFTTQFKRTNDDSGYFKYLSNHASD